MISTEPTALIPVTLLTGFLGSGKTTVLNHVLKQPGMGATAVIVNEFGEIGLDHLLVERSSEDVVLLNSGCSSASASFGSSGAFSTKRRRRRTSAANCCCELSGCRRSLSAASARSGSVSFVNLLSSSTGAKRCGYVLVPS